MPRAGADATDEQSPLSAFAAIPTAPRIASMAPFREMLGRLLRLSPNDLLAHQPLLVAGAAQPTHSPQFGVVVARQARRFQSDAAAEEPQFLPSGPEAVVGPTPAYPHIHADPAIRERPAAPPHAAASYPDAIRVATPIALKTHCRALVERPRRRFRKRLPDAAVQSRSLHCCALAAHQTLVSSHALAATGRMQASNGRVAAEEPTM